MYRLKHILLSATLLIFATVGAGAQDDAQLKTLRVDSTMLKLSMMTVEDYLNLEIPSLEVLYYNASMYANNVRFYRYETEYYKHDVKSERRKPWDWIRLIGTYSYGNSDIASISLMETTYQVWTQNTATQRNNYWNVGVTLNIPLLELFNTRNKVKQAEAKVNQTRYRMESELDELKKVIVELYCVVMDKMNVLRAISEQLVIAQAQYNFTENDFVNNKAFSEELYRSKSYETSAVREYEDVRMELNQALLKLEIASCTPIVSNLKLVRYQGYTNTNDRKEKK